jgi:hypothetical protein
MGEMRNAYRSLENLKIGDHLEDLGADIRTVLEWMLGKYSGKLCTGFFCLRIRT